ncbi:hypothetical protein BS78_K159700 [Paspalum vaginatum]|uniref:Hydrophobic seed protein domain-containing protein n=1 Tax=Paspalum vaginatum TaxID=158149 RepID=A0A9W8CEG4_9POAL|nr:hypothetical protein BS78_K159700 [Paspalum vaginatum]
MAVNKLPFVAVAMLLLVVHSELGQGLPLRHTTTTLGLGAKKLSGGSPAAAAAAAATSDKSAEDEKFAALIPVIARFVALHFSGLVLSHPCLRRVADQCGWMVSVTCVKKAISKC